MSADSKSVPEVLAQLVQVLSVVVGTVLSVRSVSEAQLKEAFARELEVRKYFDERAAEKEKASIDAARPFREMQQQRYATALSAAAKIVNAKRHTEAEVKEAETQFWDLYWAELALVEDAHVESSMKHLGDLIKGSEIDTPAQVAAYQLAHALRDSLIRTWGISSTQFSIGDRDMVAPKAVPR